MSSFVSRIPFVRTRCMFRLMGRSRQRKLERRRLQAQPTGTGAVAKFNRQSLFALLDAASASPTAAALLATLGTAFHAAITRPREGRATAGAADLKSIVDRIHGEDRRLLSLLDYKPLDPRRDVVARWGRELFRLVPGTWERPVSVVQQARFAANVVDPALIERHGFGIFDLVELSLRYQDSCCQRLQHAWPADPDPGVTAAEVDAAATFAPISEIAERCRRPTRARAALRWASRSPKEMSFDVDQMSDAYFGPILAVDADDGLRALPVGFFAEATSTIVMALVREAVADPAVEAAWNEAAAAFVRRLLFFAEGRTYSDVRVDGHDLAALMECADGLYLAVAVASPTVAVGNALERLASVGPCSTLTVGPGGTVTIPERGTVVRLAVAVGPHEVVHMAAHDDAPATVVLAEDLRWIMQTAEREDDLATFLYDLQRPYEGTRFGFGVFGMWEQWRRNDGSFHRHGLAPNAMFFAPHGEAEEWERHATDRRLEDILLALDLPDLAYWPKVVRSDDGEIVLVDPENLAHIRVLDSPVPTGIRAFAVAQRPEAVENIAAVIHWKLARCGEPVADAASSGGWATLRINVGEQPLGSPTIEVRRNEGVIIVLVDPGAAEALHADAHGVISDLGAHLAAAITSEPSDRDALSAAWDALPDAVTVDAFNLLQKATALPHHESPHPHFASEVARLLGAALMERGIQPGTWVGDEAKRFESETIHPIIREMLICAIQAVDRDAVIERALIRLERVHATRFSEEAEQARRSRLPVAASQVADVLARTRNELNSAARTLGLLIEEALLVPSTDGPEPGHLDMSELVARAEAVLASGLRSEGLHHATQTVTLTLDDSYEISVDTGPGPNVDLDAFFRAQAATTVSSSPGALRTERRPDLVEALPKLRAIDDALLSTLKFGMDDLLDTLDAVTGWEVTDHQPIAATSLEEIVAAAVSVRDGDPSRMRAAAEFLLLTNEALGAEDLEHWELDRRAVRLATRPLVALNDRVITAPWTAAASRKVLTNHLSDGRLPWPFASLPNAVRSALESYRSQRNIALERKVLEVLERLGHLTLGNIKKPKVLGLTSLPGEIDALCVDEGRRRIWVLEVKDPVMALSPHQVRNNVESFHERGAYVDKLLKKVEAIGANAPRVAKSLGAATPEGGWDVQGLMVTRRVEPAAYHRNPRVPFCTVDRVALTIESEELPPLGRKPPVSVL